jgi:hypothetical protein
VSSDDPYIGPETGFSYSNLGLRSVAELADAELADAERAVDRHLSSIRAVVALRSQGCPASLAVPRTGPDGDPDSPRSRPATIRAVQAVVAHDTDLEVIDKDRARCRPAQP